MKKKNVNPYVGKKNGIEALLRPFCTFNHSKKSTGLAWSQGPQDILVWNKNLLVVNDHSKKGLNLYFETIACDNRWNNDF